MAEVELDYIFTWHALSDACPKCRSLNGKEYRNPDVYRSTVWDAVWGDIWHLDRGHSLAHPNCRCQLEVTSVSVDAERLFAELKQELLKLKDVLLERLGK